MNIRKINIPKAFDRIGEHWSPHIAAQVNGQDVRLAKIKGAFEWHHHDGIDEAFFVVKGAFTMRFRDGGEEWNVEMSEGDFITVPAGVEHMPVAEAECCIMLIENAGTVNTGEHESERTRRDLPML
ncbi:MAG: cupin domain-containing protein [Pseudomonadota bacterium]